MEHKLPCAGHIVLDNEYNIHAADIKEDKRERLPTKICVQLWSGSQYDRTDVTNCK